MFGPTGSGNDGQTPSSVEVISNAINRITIDSRAGDEAHPFSELLENQAPAYSASLLSGMNSPLLWYNFDYSEAFPMKPANPMGERTIIGVVFGNGSIVVAGGCAWDADSNLGTLGNIPATAIRTRVSPTSIYPQLKVFDNVAGYCYGPPTSLNNHPFYNPLFMPRVRSPDNRRPVADTEEEVDEFLRMIGGFKETWVNRLKCVAAGFNGPFADYLNRVYQPGFEPEILIEPKTDSQPYCERKFDRLAIGSIGFFADGKKHGVHSAREYRDKAGEFLKKATDPTAGWINPFEIDNEFPPLLSIIGVALPDVPVSGTSSAKNKPGNEWVTYLTSPDFGYGSPLTPDHFQWIE
jgi:hypothetical protein